MTDALAKKLPGLYPIIMIGLTLASFPGACFSSFIAANSFKTVMPKVNPFLSVGIGAIVSMILALTKVAGNLPQRLRDHRRLVRPDLRRDGRPTTCWREPLVRPARGLQPGRLDRVGTRLPGRHPAQPARLERGRSPTSPPRPVAAFIVGFAVYFACAKIGVISPVFRCPNRADAV